MRLFMKNEIQTEAYISDYGYLVIKQPETDGKYESEILLSPGQVEKILSLITECKTDQINLWENDVDNAPE